MIQCMIIVFLRFFTVSGFERSASSPYSTSKVNITVTQGETAILPCQVKNKEAFNKVIWMNPKRILISEDERRYIDDHRMSIERPIIGDWNLHIRNVKYEDRGEYTCTVNIKPVQTKRIRLIVQVPSEILDYASSSSRRVREGENVHLWCNATGVPPPAVTWYRLTEYGMKRREKVGNAGELLVIRNVSRHCGGRYKCMAYNGVAHAVTREIDVNVLFAPEVNIFTRRMGQYRGKDTVLDCQISASPQGVNEWKRDGVAFGKDSNWKYRTDIYEDGKYGITMSLRIIRVELEDYGVYTCEAQNGLGRASAQIELYEYFDPTTTTTTTSIATMPVVQPVNFNKQTKSSQRDRERPSDNSNGKESRPNNKYNGKYDANQNGHRSSYRDKNVYANPNKQVTGQLGTGYSPLNTAPSTVQVNHSTIFFTSFLLVLFSGLKNILSYT